MTARSPADLAELLEGAAMGVLVDAAVGPPPGRVLDVRAEDLTAEGVRPWSSHAVSVPAALALARVASPGRIPSEIRFVAITIDPPGEASVEISPAVAEAVKRAVVLVRAHLR